MPRNSFVYAGLALISIGAWAVRRRSKPEPRSRTQPRLYLGIDCSTQSLTAVVIDENQDIVCEKSINYQHALPHYGVTAGVIRNVDNSVVAPTVMFIEALDRVLDEIRRFVDVSLIVSISGCAQQHGAVFWRRSVQNRLAELNHCFSLRQQLKDCFAIAGPPIWMDSSTTEYCRRFEEIMGGAKAVAQLSGSRAYERFTGIQISKIITESKEKFDDCERISLISSMFASIFLGKFAPIDQSDASGMILMDLETKCWSMPLVTAAAGSTHCAQLLELLGENPVPSFSALGPISEYFVRRYGFSEKCQIIAFTGDNPSTLAGLGTLDRGSLAVSLGTSDTMFAVVPKEARFELTGSIFVNPVSSDTNMLMICIKNGSLAREEIRNFAANKSWETFSILLNSNQPGNSGFIGFFYFEPEIAPAIQKTGIHLVSPFDEPINFQDASPAVQVRAVIESQFLSMCYHAKMIGVEPERIVVTGGASVNHELLTVCANVFNAPVYTAKCCSDAAAFGSALRARHGYMCISEATEFSPKTHIALSKSPDPEAAQIYREMLIRFERLLEKLIKQA